MPPPFPVEPTSGLGPYWAGGGGPHLNTTPKRPQPRVPPEQPGLSVTKQSKGAGRGPPGERRARAATYPEGWALAGASARRIVGPAVGDAAPPGSGERRPPRGAGAVPRRGSGQAPPPAARPVGKRGAVGFHFLDRRARGSQEEAGPGGQGLFVRSHSAAAACSPEPPGERGSRAAPLGPGLAAGGAGVEGCAGLSPWPARGACEGNLQESLQVGTGQRGAQGRQVTRPRARLEAPPSQREPHSSPSAPKAGHLLHIPDT